MIFLYVFNTFLNLLLAEIKVNGDSHWKKSRDKQPQWRVMNYSDLPQLVNQIQ